MQRDKISLVGSVVVHDRTFGHSAGAQTCFVEMKTWKVVKSMIFIGVRPILRLLVV